MSIISEFLEDIRTEKAMSQKEFADVCKLPVSVIVDIEEKNLVPNEEILKCFSVGTGIPLPFFLYLCVKKEDFSEEGWSIFKKLNPEASERFEFFYDLKESSVNKASDVFGKGT